VKQLLSLVIFLVLFTSCKKQQLEQVILNPSEKTTIQKNAIPTPAPAPAYSWRLATTFNAVQYPYTCKTCPTLLMPVNEDVYLLAGSLLEFMFRFNPSLRKFESYTPPPTNSVGFTLFSVGHQYLFSYGTKIYGGLRDDGPDRTFFFSIDPQTNIIQELARYPGTYTSEAVAFVLGNKGYLVSGYTSTETSKVWEYDFTANAWRNIGNSPLGRRNGSSAFVINNKVYMGLGYENAIFNGQSIRVYKKDWIQYTPGSSYFGNMADFPGAGRGDAQGFIINNNLYLGFGRNITTKTRFKDLWRYNASSNNWTQQADWPGVYGFDDSTYGIPLNNLGVFSSGSNGYLVKGVLSEFWHFTNSLFVIN
jgi:hypothetical protein